MNKPDPAPLKLPSLADYMVRYDLSRLLEEAKLDYGHASSGAPRLLNQKDITARFRRAAKRREENPNG